MPTLTCSTQSNLQVLLDFDQVLRARVQTVPTAKGCRLAKQALAGRKIQ